MNEQEEKSSDQQSSQLDDLLTQDAATGEGGGQAVQEFDFVSVAEWPDELKPQVATQYQRKRPIQGAWVMLGNDELWLIPEVEFLGKDVEVKQARNIWGHITISFDAQYKHHKKLRELMARILASQQDDGWAVEWDNAYMLMYLALQVNYKIAPEEITRLGLLRQEHVADVLVALAGSAKKKEPLAEPELPLPLTAVS